MNDVQQELTSETVLQLLSHPQRRQIVTQVARTEHATTVDQLSSDSTQTDRPSPNGDETADTLSIDLHHVHLPKLQEAGVVVYDSDEQTIRAGRQLDDVVELLTLIEEYVETSSTLTA